MTVLAHEELATMHIDTIDRDVYYRPGTSDEQVLKDVFFYRYQRPPVALQPATVLDCGAHIGATMLDYRHLWPDAAIVGVEMDAGNTAVARLNTDDPVLCAALAGSLTPSVAIYSRAGEPWAYSQHDWDGSVGYAATVTLRSLTAALGWDTIDFLKLDIEGAEQAVIQDTDGLERVRSLVVECHHGYKWHQARTALCAAGFKVDRHSVHPNAAFAWREP